MSFDVKPPINPTPSTPERIVAYPALHQMYGAVARKLGASVQEAAV